MENNQAHYLRHAKLLEELADIIHLPEDKVEQMKQDAMKVYGLTKSHE